MHGGGKSEFGKLLPVWGLGESSCDSLCEVTIVWWWVKLWSCISYADYVTIVCDLIDIYSWNARFAHTTTNCVCKESATLIVYNIAHDINYVSE